MEELSSRKRIRDESEDSRFDSPEVKRIREDLLESFDDAEFYMASHELDSFMKSFEEEIESGRSAGAELSTVAVVDLISESGDSQPDFGYLLGASDNEIGLPPSTSKEENGREEMAELIRVLSDSSELNGLWEFDEGIPSFDSLDFGIGDGGSYNAAGGEYVSLDGLFDYSDVGYGSADLS